MKSRPGHGTRGPIGERGPGEVRIIAGAWRRRSIPVPAVEGLRPTPNRVRETVFNWLSHAYGGDFSDRSVLDLFAGSGALGFEAASRGAARVVLVDRDRSALAQLEATRTMLGAMQVEIQAADGLTFATHLGQTGARFDMIFLDPPFGHRVIDDALPLAAALLAAAGYLYVESESALREETLAALDLSLHRADKAGEVFYHLLRRNIQEQ